MESRAKLLGHPVHPMLIVFPLGLLATSVGFDIAYLVSGNGRWADIAYSLIGVGVVTGLAAAVFGIVDWAAIPSNTRAKRIGTYHGLGNVVVVLFFAISWYLRRDMVTTPPGSAITLSVLAAGLALVTGWLGGELVDRLGVGVDDNANVNAPSSLTEHTPSHGFNRTVTRGV